jgi:hypothetical protein
MSEDYEKRINKLDSFFLWVASLSGVGFSIFIAYLKLPVLPYAPIFVIIALSLGIGYLNGAVFNDSFTNRMRGWNYFLTGLAIYVPLVSIKFSEPYFVANNISYSNFEPVLSATAGIIFVVLYLIFTIKVTPLIYRNLGRQYGVVTKRILNRSTVASVILGFSLFILVLAIGLLSNWVTLTIFVVIFFLFISPLVTEERRIKKINAIREVSRLRKH